MKSELTVNLYLYETDAGGRKSPIKPGDPIFRCPAFAQKDKAPGGWTCFIDVGGTPMVPGETRAVGVSFLANEGLEVMRRAGKFCLWDGKFFGEADLVSTV